MSPYTCATCGTPVAVFDGSISRTCGHRDAAVVAHMDAVAYGEGHAKDEPQGAGHILATLWRRIFKSTPPLACSMCGAPAVVKDGRTLRACAHVHAGVTRGGV